jgi:hypothetical protein
LAGRDQATYLLLKTGLKVDPLIRGGTGTRVAMSGYTALFILKAMEGGEEKLFITSIFSLAGGNRKLVQGAFQALWRNQLTRG